MRYIAKDVFSYLMIWAEEHEQLYPNTEFHFILRDKNTLCLRFSETSMVFLEDFMSYARMKELFFYIVPEDEGSFLIEIKPPEFAKMTPEERNEARKKEKDNPLNIDFMDYLKDPNDDEELIN